MFNKLLAYLLTTLEVAPDWHRL